jgi:hypothetical protein
MLSPGERLSFECRKKKEVYVECIGAGGDWRRNLRSKQGPQNSDYDQEFIFILTVVGSQ